MDSDLAILYGVETRALNQQVQRNLERFPEDFMFQLTSEEWENLKSQSVISSWGGRRKQPYVFTEHGVLMLSSVLTSKKAIAVNIQIMRIFIKLREMLLSQKDVLVEMEKMRQKVTGQDERIEVLYKYLKRFVQEKEKPRTKVGYK